MEISLSIEAAEWEVTEREEDDLLFGGWRILGVREGG